MSEAAKKRDEWLKERGHKVTIVQAAVSQLPAYEETISPRHALLQELSPFQSKVYQIANTQTGYFTAQSLSAAEGFELEQTRRCLALLEATGLIHRVSLVRSQSSETNPKNSAETLVSLEFAPIYRALKSEDDSRADDIAALQAAYPELGSLLKLDETPLS
ncbi:MAG: hypothetical protein HZB31_08300 [Nitrospirae bacterium]|nr:hypothetical protein [Nitrospirota bacterium]